jgi:hypothetical protein
MAGTVITTGNIPSSVVVPEAYSIVARAIQLSATSAAIGRNVDEPTHGGSFTFSDSSWEEPLAPLRDNSFNVRATGGVKFLTGTSRTGRNLGVVLEAGSSAWSALSDRESKDQIREVDGVKVLKKLIGMPITTWSYEGEDAVRHMGPMAQDFYGAFGLGSDSRRISTIDADGVALASLHGLHSAHERLAERADSLKRMLEEEEKALRANEQLLGQNEADLMRQDEWLREMESLLGIDASAHARELMLDSMAASRIIE